MSQINPIRNNRGFSGNPQKPAESSRKRLSNWISAHKNSSSIDFKATPLHATDVKRVALGVFSSPEPVNAVLAVVRALDPALDQTSGEIAAYIMRGDIITYVRRHPDLYRHKLSLGNDVSNDRARQLLGNWCEAIVLSQLEDPIFEFEVLTDIFKRPIHLLRGDEEKIIGEQHTGEPILLEVCRGGYCPAN